MHIWNALKKMLKYVCVQIVSIGQVSKGKFPDALYVFTTMQTTVFQCVIVISPHLVSEDKKGQNVVAAQDRDQLYFKTCAIYSLYCVRHPGIKTKLAPD